MRISLSERVREAQTWQEYHSGHRECRVNLRISQSIFGGQERNREGFSSLRTTEEQAWEEHNCYCAEGTDLLMKFSRDVKGSKQLSSE